MYGATAAAPASATTMRITRYEVIPVRVPMHERIREPFSAAYRKQGIFRDYYDSTIVKLYTDEGLVGVGDALLDVEDSLGSVPRAEATLKRLVGRSPWEFLLDDSLGGILMAVYDLVGQAAGLPVSRLFSANPKKRIIQTWWSQCLPLGRTTVQQALMAEATGVPLWIEHSIITGVSQVFEAHQTAAFPGIEYAISITHVIQDDLMREPFEMKNGRYEVPTTPGLGVSFDDDAVEKYRRG